MKFDPGKKKLREATRKTQKPKGRETKTRKSKFLRLSLQLSYLKVKLGQESIDMFLCR